MNPVRALRWMLAASSCVGLTLMGCAHQPVLMPDPAATRALGAPSIAVGEAAGVRVFAQGNAWKGVPYDLPKVITPVLITVENHSGRPLRLSYPDLTLVGASGFEYAALPPIARPQSVGQAAPAPAKAGMAPAAYDPAGAPPPRPPPPPPPPFHPHFYHEGFMVAPTQVFVYPGLTPWPYPFPYDPYYFNHYYAYWPQPLPSADMLSQALPEGVIQPDGKIQGFIYFQGAGQRETRAKLQMNLVDAETGESFGTIAIPMVVSR